MGFYREFYPISDADSGMGGASSFNEIVHSHRSFLFSAMYCTVKYHKIPLGIILESTQLWETKRFGELFEQSEIVNSMQHFRTKI